METKDIKIIVKYNGDELILNFDDGINYSGLLHKYDKISDYLGFNTEKILDEDCDNEEIDDEEDIEDIKSIKELAADEVDNLVRIIKKFIND